VVHFSLAALGTVPSSNKGIVFGRMDYVQYCDAVFFMGVRMRDLKKFRFGLRAHPPKYAIAVLCSERRKHNDKKTKTRYHIACKYCDTAPRNQHTITQWHFELSPSQSHQQLLSRLHYQTTLTSRLHSLRKSLTLFSFAF
jgi:hypothetical protein